jgi:hypothetical protein
MRFTCLILVLFAASVYTSPMSYADDVAATFSQWKDDVQVDPRVAAEMKRFVRDGETLGGDYVQSAVLALRGLVFDAATTRLAEIGRGNREDFIEVEFPDAGFVLGKNAGKLSAAEEDFEDGFVRTEFRAFVSCEGVTPKEALRLYTSADFRMQMSSRTRRIWDDGDDNCVETRKKTFVPAMMSCNRITEIHRDGFSAQHSQVVSNPGGDGYQVVYFKESIKTFVSVPGGLVLHYINYSRSKRVTGIAHGLVRSKLKGTEEDAIALLAEKLAGRQ